MCDTLTVSGANDDTFNGLYKVSNLTVSWAADEDVYQQVDGDKVIFPLNSSNEDEWGIGLNSSLTSGYDDYRGSSSNQNIISF